MFFYFSAGSFEALPCTYSFPNAVSVGIGPFSFLGVDSLKADL